MMKQPRVVFLTLACFSLTGGIEKVCRALAKVLSSISTASYVLSLVDTGKDLDQRYLAPDHFRGFERNKIAFLWASFCKGLRSDIVILSHINLLVAARLIRSFRPKTRIIVLAHGIEVWRPLSAWKIKFLKKIEIWAVSKHTKAQLVKLHGLNPLTIKVQNNCLDPFFEIPVDLQKPEYLLKRYQIQDGQKILFSLCRLSHQESYKGYDQVIKALPSLIEKYPSITYLIGGKADEKELLRLNTIIKDLNLEKQVKILGYIKDDEVTDHFKLADVFAMPSHEEGFGIVFIESAACGCPPLAGNQDGSVDALLNGELGGLVNPFSVQDISVGLSKFLNRNDVIDYKNKLQAKCLHHFAFERYQAQVHKYLVTAS